MNTKVKKILNILGNIITLVAVFFVFRKLFTSSLDYTILFKQQNIFTITGITLILTIIIITNCYPWKKLVEIFSAKKMPWRDTIMVYTKSNLLKYLPGNVFQYVGRNELATKREIPHLKVATATVFDIFINVLAAVVLSSIYFFQHGFSFHFNSQTILFICIGFIALILGAAVVVYAFREKAHAFLKTIKQFITLQTLKGFVSALIYYIFTMMIQSLLFTALLVYVLDVSLNPQLFLQLFSAYTFSWLVGFITPGAPAGIGIREAVMAGATGGLINEGVITFAMVIFRVLTTVADGLAFLLVLIFNMLKKDGQHKESSIEK
ncbi:lysylphosphatidylglycerol synthase domain-containing protein [Enterococcus sp. LJL128]